MTLVSPCDLSLMKRGLLSYVVAGAIVCSVLAPSAANAFGFYSPLGQHQLLLQSLNLSSVLGGLNGFARGRVANYIQRGGVLGFYTQTYNNDIFSRISMINSRGVFGRFF